jgi:hypothetical protein
MCLKPVLWHFTSSRKTTGSVAHAIAVVVLVDFIASQERGHNDERERPRLRTAADVNNIICDWRLFSVCVMSVCNVNGFSATHAWFEWHWTALPFWIQLQKDPRSQIDSDLQSRTNTSITT